MRRVVHIVIEASYIMFNLVLSILRLGLDIASNMQDALAEVEFWFTKIILLMFDAVQVKLCCLLNMVLKFCCLSKFCCLLNMVLT